MSGASEIVNLLDDDSDDDEQPAQIKEMMLTSQDSLTIDLCDDSSDSEQLQQQTPDVAKRNDESPRHESNNSATVTVSHQKKSTRMTRRYSPIKYNDDSDDDIPTGPVFAKRNSAITTSIKQGEHRQPSSLSTAKPSLTAKKPPTRARPGGAETIHIDDSDDDDDDEDTKQPASQSSIASSARPAVHNPYKAKKTHTSVAKKQTPNIDNDSDSDPMLTPSAFARKKPRRSAAASSSSLTKQRSSLSSATSVRSSKLAKSPPSAIYPSKNADYSDSEYDTKLPASQSRSSPSVHNPQKKAANKISTSVAKKAPPNADNDSDSDAIPGPSAFAKKPAIRGSRRYQSPQAMASAKASKPVDDSSDSELEILDMPAFAKEPSATQNRSTTRQVSVAPTSPTRQRPFPYPALLVSSKQYEDQRAKFALSFWKYSRPLTIRAHERSRVDQMMKKVVRLALSDHPIRSVEEFLCFGRSSVSNSAAQKDEVERQLHEGGFPQCVTPATRYGQGFYTITEACLVVLYERVQSKLVANKDLLDALEDKESWISLEDMIPHIDGRLRPECPGKLTRRDEPDNGAAYYLQQSTRSAEFLQIAKLECELGDECGARIKRHSRQGKIYFELLQVGYTDAKRIRDRSFPAPKGHYRTSKIVGEVQDDYKGICLGVDRQEGGRFKLHEMCSKLDMCHVPYFVGSLAIGDYVFFTSHDGSARLDYLCPIIIERKSIQDLAMSIYDGRWQSQKSRMYKGQFIFGYNKCRMVYIIEGNDKGQQVTGGYIGNRWFEVDIEKLNQEIDNLKAEGFEVIRTPSRENTMFQLARWAKRVANEIREGTLQAEYTYQQFKDKLKKIPSDTDFSRLAKYYAAEKLAAEVVDLDDDESKTVTKKQVGGNLKSVQPAAKRPKVKADDDEFTNVSAARLKELCKSVGVAASGSKQELIERYRGPHPPKVWRDRKRKEQWVPASHNVAGTALLVALYLHEKKTGGLDNGLSRDELYVKAEELNITKNPFSGGTTQTGPYHYDGWSSMKSLLKGDPALMKLSTRRYKLTRSCNLAGFCFAEAMHKWCHEYNNCPCGEEA